MKFKKTLSAFLASVLTLGALCLPANAQSVAVGGEIRTYEAASVSTPYVSLASGSYISKDGLKVSLQPILSGDEVWYSTNGTGFRRYSEPLSITQNTVLRSYTVRNGQRSEIDTRTYTLLPELTLNLKQGVYQGAQRVFISSSTRDVKFFYTLDGTTPTERSTPYSSSTGILIKKSSNLKVAAIKSGWKTNTSSQTYIIIGGQAASDDTPDDGGLINPSIDPVSKSKLDDYKSKWYYNQLTSSQKAAYERIFSAAKEHAASTNVSDLKIKAADLSKAYWACDYDNPQFLANGSGYGYSYNPVTGLVVSVSIQYGRTENQIKAIETSFKNITDSVVKEADKQISDYEKLKYIHDWIINRTKYNKTAGAYVSEADGAVIYGRALCEGYSKTFMYLAQELGYDCICVTGDVGSEGHMWNMIKIGGSWYHVDVTHDDPIMSDGSDVLFHDYFLISTSDIRRTRTIDTALNIPSALRSY